MAMVDWITATFHLSHVPISGGSVISLDQNGEVEWETAKRLGVEGSYSSKVQIRTVREAFGEGMALWVSGNPVKFFQGHNLWGSGDVHGLALALLVEIMARMPDRFHPTEAQLDVIRRGLYKLSRVDVTKNLSLGSRADVRSWIRAASVVARGRHQTASAYNEQTLYLGQKSRRKTIKVYCKGDEIEAHPLPDEMPDVERSRLLAYADDLLRVEITLRSQALEDRGLDLAKHWCYDTPSRLHAEEIKALQLPENVPPRSDDLVEQLPSRLRAVYKLWLQGEDVRDLYPKRTFYRYRSELLKHGIDLHSPPRKAETNNVVPLWRYLVAQEVAPPEWAKGTPLYFEPSAYLAAKGY